MKSGCGCGFFVSENIIKKLDLDSHVYNKTNEFECKWIEI